VAHFTVPLPTLFIYRRPLLTLTPSPSPSCAVGAFPSPSWLLPLVTHLSAHLPPSSWPSPRSSLSLVEAAPRCRAGAGSGRQGAASPSRTGGASEAGSGGAMPNSSPCSPWPATATSDARTPGRGGGGPSSRLCPFFSPRRQQPFPCLPPSRSAWDPAVAGVDPTFSPSSTSSSSLGGGSAQASYVAGSGGAGRRDSWIWPRSLRHSPNHRSDGVEEGSYSGIN
jgi:hypothetical protein